MTAANTKADGGPAFPVHDAHAASPKDVTELRTFARGMTLRDYFAAKALAALLSRVEPVGGDYVTNATPDQAAESAYLYADAMLRARESA